MLRFKDLSTVFVNDISELINKVACTVDESTLFVDKLTMFVELFDHEAFIIFVNLAGYIVDVKPSSVIIEQLR